MDTNIAKTGPGNIQKFTFTSKTGGQVDASSVVVEYRYYESILSPTVTSTASIVETGLPKGILDGLPIRGGEKVDIKVTDTKNNEIHFPLRVNRVRDVDADSLTDLYFVDFISEEGLNNEITRVKGDYEGKISDNVSKILTDVLGATELDIDETSLSYNFNGNIKKPFYVCTALAAKSLPKEGSTNTDGLEGAAGYLFYQTRDGMCFKSIDQLFKKKPVKRYIYNSSGRSVVGYNDNILNYNIITNTDMDSNLSMGTYNNETIYFNFFDMTYKIKKYDINEQKRGATPAGKDYVFVSDDFIDKPSRIYQAILDIGCNPPGRGDKQLDNWKKRPTEPNFKYEETMVQTIMRYNQLFTIQIEIVIPGDFSIRAGDLVECTFPALEVSKNKDKNKQSSYTYMVASVCHRITSRDTFTSIELIRDSFGKQEG